MKEIRCLKCKEKNVIRKGGGETRLGYRQFYYCKDCGKGFIASEMSNKTYGPGVIINAVGYSKHVLVENFMFINYGDEDGGFREGFIQYLGPLSPSSKLNQDLEERKTRNGKT